MTAFTHGRRVWTMLLGLACHSAVLSAQGPSGAVVAAPASTVDSLRPSRWSQPVFTVRYGTYRLRANSEFYRLIDDALNPGSRSLRPNLWSAEVALGMTSRLRMQLGLEHGSRSIGSQSRAMSITGSAAAQRTMLSLSSVYLAGAQWRVGRWSSQATGRDRARLFLQAGAGVSRYRLRQSGEFIDANRRVTFGNDFSSSGIGGAGYLGAAVELPLQPWLAIAGDWRLQRGSAPMTDDFASFDRLDLGGARASLGLSIFARGQPQR